MEKVINSYEGMFIVSLANGEEAAKAAKQKARLQDLSDQVEDFIGEPVEEY